MTRDDLISKVNDGRTASVLLGWMDQHFKDIERDLLASLKSNFRAGTYTELVLACHVAQLCSIEDLKEKIKAVANGGDSAAKEMQREEEQPLL